MTNEPAEKVAMHMARLQAAGAVAMTVEEILAGKTQAGLPRPAILDDDKAEQEVAHGAH